MKKATVSALAAQRRESDDGAGGLCIGPEPTDGGPLGTLKRRAGELGWQCLADVWVGYHTRYGFECAHGHRFERRPTQMLYRELECTECQRDALRDRWLATVVDRGGELVEGTFTGLLERYRLRCAAGHEWEAQGRKISEGNWCPACAHEASARRNRLSDGLARLWAAARTQGGRCDAIEYIDGRQRYPFECAKGHRWEAQGSEVMRGSWCKICACMAAGAATFDKDGLARLQEAARAHAGQCLSGEYLGSVEKYRFRCAVGHEWDAIASQIWLGHWCDTRKRSTERRSQEHTSLLARVRPDWPAFDRLVALDVLKTAG
ncbi:hypothetical protein PQQ86_13800 [Paraburkholderia sediminicola]|uniref:hypothetical protein n=1 Tax=Paraburkholderia sediminicola TaxID=458836 RepID=UPI0038BD0762